MADAKQGYDDVVAMITELQKDPYAKLTDDKVLRLLQLWVDSAISIKGDGMFAPLKLAFGRRGDPGKPPHQNLSWREELFASLQTYKKAISDNKDNPDPKAFQAVQDSMVGLVESYWNQYKKDSKEDKAFDQKIKVLFANEGSMIGVGTP
jgi:hypothetical protein